MAAVEARKGRFIFPVDFLWMKLSDDKALPVNQVSVTSIKAKLTQTLLPPNAGYRLVDKEKIKVDATLGIRYWHLGEDFTLQPSDLSKLAVSKLGGRDSRSKDPDAAFIQGHDYSVGPRGCRRHECGLPDSWLGGLQD
jgi:hypothetical protein